MQPDTRRHDDTLSWFDKAHKDLGAQMVGAVTVLHRARGFVEAIMIRLPEEAR